MSTDDLDEDFVAGSLAPGGRRVWIARPEEGEARRLVVFLDGELYLERVGAVAVLRELMRTGAVPPLLAVFVSYQGREERHVDFVMSEDYTTFLARDLQAWLPGLRPPAGPAILAGLSLSGLAAAHAALRHPDIFSPAICQSPSFWWEGERFRAALPPAPEGAPPLWVCVGSEETEEGVSHPPSGMFQGTCQIDSCRRTADDLLALGYETEFRVFPGGHDPACWKDDLALALPWAIGR